MKAVTYTEYGITENLKLQEVEKPVPGDEEVLVCIHSVSINDWDWGLLQGTPFANRAINGLRKPKKFKILGSDIAGKVEAVGKNVKKFKKGDDVYGDLSDLWGGFAEYVCASPNALEKKPATMTFDQAAAIPQAGMLAVQGLIDRGDIQPGQKILINGAGGGVGTLGVQIAKTFNATVTGVDSAGKLEMMQQLGFDQVIDYEKEDFTQSNESFDLVLDNKINRSVFSYLRVLSPTGIYVITGGSMGRLFQALVLAPLISLFSKKKVRLVMLKPNKDLTYINELFEAGKFIPKIDKPFSLSETAAAMDYFGSGKHLGKIVISIKE